MNNLPARTEGLPASLIDMAEILGLSVALKVIQAFGGQELRFPQKPPPDHPIIKALGETDGYAVCDYLAGEMVYIPHGRAGQNRRAVAGMVAAGLSRRDIVKALGISQRHVRRLANGRVRNEDQPDLFDD